MRITQGKQLHLRNVPSAIATYFGVHGFRIKESFPWFYPEEEETVIGWPRNDVIEPFSTVPVSMPALSLLAIIGIATLSSAPNDSLKRARLPAATLFAGGSLGPGYRRNYRTISPRLLSGVDHLRGSRRCPSWFEPAPAKRQRPGGGAGFGKHRAELLIFFHSSAQEFRHTCREVVGNRAASAES